MSEPKEATGNAYVYFMLMLIVVNLAAINCGINSVNVTLKQLIPTFEIKDNRVYPTPDKEQR